MIRLPETRTRSGLTPWIAVSGCLHAALALALWSASLVAAPEPAPSPPLRVTILHEAAGDGAPVAKTEPPPAAARPAPPPKPKTALALPAPESAPAPAPEPAFASESSASEAAADPSAAGEAGGTATLAAVAAGPPGGDPLAAYIRQVRDSIARHKRYPALARRRGIEGRVVLRVAIAPDGSLAASEAVDSPSLVLARSALEAVEAASPFAPPPAGAVRIEVPIRFALQE